MTTRTSRLSFLLLALLSIFAVAAQAATRTISISAPASTPAGSHIHVVVGASTDAGDGEKIGFLHSEFSLDGGATFKPITYITDGKAAVQAGQEVVAGAAGTKIVVRVRVAYRGGKAGDVDYDGKPINWEKSWSKWEEPPTKTVTVDVVAK